MNDIVNSVETFLNEYVVIGIILKILLVVLIAFFALKMLKKILHKALMNNKVLQDNRRAATMAGVIFSVLKWVVYFIVLMILLSLFNINIAPVLASAGVVGVALGFGAQTLVKDTLAGFFIIFDNYFAVGDYITACGVSGFVEELGLRATKIRDWTGEVHIFGNGEITRVTNYSQGDVCNYMSVPLAYNNDLDAAMAAIQQACDTLKTTGEGLHSGPDILGLDTLDSDRMIIKLCFEADLNDKWTLERQLRRLIKDNLDAAGCATAPYYHVLLERDARQAAAVGPQPQTAPSAKDEAETETAEEVPEEPLVEKANLDAEERLALFRQALEKNSQEKAAQTEQTPLEKWGRYYETDPEKRHAKANAMFNEFIPEEDEDEGDPEDVEWDFSNVKPKTTVQIHRGNMRK